MKDFLSELALGLRHILPFVIFLVLTGLTSVVPMGPVWVYPIKTIVVGTLLILFWKGYPEIHPTYSDVKPIVSTLIAIVVGVIVFVVWIVPEGYYPLLGKSSEPFNPYNTAYLSGIWVFVWIGFRLFGSSVVVPVMEELFWRSFLIRYLINPNFKEVPIGQFSWVSFGATVLLFGAEHQRWLVGLLAGIIYNLLLYRTKSVFACTLAHGITNLVLGVYVLLTHQWAYW